MNGALHGRVVIVTGAASGLGRAHAIRCADEGARLVLNDVDDVTELADQLTTSGHEVVAVEGDVADMATALRLVDAAREAFGDLHVVVNNAGFVRDSAMLDMTERDFDAVLAVHVKGCFSTMQAAARLWSELFAGGSRSRRAIVNTGSSTGLHGNPGQLNYSAAKAAVAMMTVVAASELAELGVTVNCIAPIARTPPALARPGFAEVVAEPAEPDTFDRFHPDNVAPLVVYLASEACRFSGQVFSAHGGHVGLYGGWSIAHQLEHGRRWAPDDLRAALESFPLRIAAQRALTNTKEER